MLKITCIRHMLTEYNKRKIFQGQFDCECSQEGIKETEKLATTFKRDYEYCYASPLKRAYTTAKILMPNFDIILDERLVERSFGVYEKTPIEESKKILIDSGFVPEGAESAKEVEVRIIDFLDDLKKKHKDGAKILVVTHGGIVRAIKRAILHTEDVGPDNLEMLEFEY